MTSAAKRPRTICQKDILARGWNKPEIDRILGEPDFRATNPRDSSAHPMKLWIESRVLSAESEPELASKLAQRRALKATRKVIDVTPQPAPVAPKRDMRKDLTQFWQAKLQAAQAELVKAQQMLAMLTEAPFDLSGHQPARSSQYWWSDKNVGPENTGQLFFLFNTGTRKGCHFYVSWRIQDSAKARAILEQLEIDWTKLADPASGHVTEWFAAAGTFMTAVISHEDGYKLSSFGDCTSESYYD